MAVTQAQGNTQQASRSEQIRKFMSSMIGCHWKRNAPGADLGWDLIWRRATDVEGECLAVLSWWLMTRHQHLFVRVSSDTRSLYVKR